MVWIKSKQHTDSEVAVTFRVEEGKVILTYGVGSEAYFHNVGYNGFVEIVAGIEGKVQAYTQNISRKGAGKSYGKREGY